MITDNEKALKLAIGKTVISVDKDGPSATEPGEDGSYEVSFRFADGTTLRFFHRQDCCEHVRLVDAGGDMGACIGAALVSAEESTQLNDEYSTWTFYLLAFSNGERLNLRFLGESNGYYSESIDVELVAPERDEEEA